MRTPNVRILALLAALAVAAGAAILAGCDSTPAEPNFDSPWDPDGPDGGDALAVTAIAGDTTVTVTWNQPQGQGITSYLIGHALNAGGPWEDIEEVAATTGASGIYFYQQPTPTTVHYFRVQAFTDNEYSIVGYGRTGYALMPPRVVPATGSRLRASRYLDLVMTVTTGDTLQVADNDSFNRALSFPVVEAGQPQTVSLDLGEAADNHTFNVYTRAVSASGFPSTTSSLDFVADFGPRHYVAGRPTSVASRLVDLVVPSEGVTAMRFALSAEDLALAEWLAPADTVHGFPLAETANVQTVHGEYQGDFGYSTTHTQTVTPDGLTSTSFSLIVPPNRVIDTGVVTAACTARATLMRFAENASFAGVAWQAYDDTAVITLSAGEGRKTVYAQFRNDWADSPILTDYVDVVVQPVGVAFLAPADGAAVTGGVRLQVRGTALAGSTDTAVDSVRVDLGDGVGWRTPTGTSSWSIMWDAPAVIEATGVTLRARAWITDSATSAVDSATALVTVTVQAP